MIRSGHGSDTCASFEGRGRPEGQFSQKDETVRKVKLVVLLSGGIDSPVAARMMLDRGVELVGVHMDCRPFTDTRELNKAKSLLIALREAVDGALPLYIVPHGSMLEEFKSKCNSHLQCVLCKRMMLRVAGIIGEREGAKAIVTGESLGQVASQTLLNMAVEAEAVHLPVLRPLVGLDKEEIIRKAKAAGTYELSISPGKGCTAVPKGPSTGASLLRVLREEGRVDVAQMAEDAVNDSVLI